MKKIIFISLLFAMSTQIGFSQSYDINRSEKNKSFAQQVDQKYIDWSIQSMEEANKLLALTDEQQDEIVYINLTFGKRMQILQDKGTPPEDFKKHKTDIITSAINTYPRVLDESQLAIFNENKDALIENSIK